jgi:hypothetical protein
MSALKLGIDDKLGRRKAEQGAVSGRPAPATYQTFEIPPRHVYTPKDTETLTHSLGVALPWK